MTPFDYSEINLAAGTYTPSTVKRNSKAFRFWLRSLFQRAESVIKFNGLPEDWKLNSDKFYDWLFLYGFIGVLDVSEYGTIFNKCDLYGQNLYYKPTEIIVSNPALRGGSIRKKIGVDAALIKLTPDFQGIIDICVYYAEKLSLLDGAQNTSFINSKIPFMLGAKNKAAAEMLKKMLDKVNSGEPTVIYDIKAEDNIKNGDSPFHVFKLFEGTDYISDKLLQDTQTILNEFDCEIGIQTLPYQKAERMVTSEADSKKQDSIARCTTWLRCINDSLPEVNSMFNLNISAELTFDNVGEVVTNGKDDTLRI